MQIARHLAIQRAVLTALAPGLPHASSANIARGSRTGALCE